MGIRCNVFIWGIMVMLICGCLSLRIMLCIYKRVVVMVVSCGRIGILERLSEIFIVFCFMVEFGYIC